MNKDWKSRVFYLGPLCKTDEAGKPIGKMVYLNSIAEAGGLLAFLERIGEKDTPFMLATGQLDKNGREIYEGDIVAYTDDVAGKSGRDVVRLEGPCFQPLTAIPIYATQTIEVVGNIHENPELLTGDRAEASSAVTPALNTEERVTRIETTLVEAGEVMVNLGVGGRAGHLLKNLLEAKKS